MSDTSLISLADTDDDGNTEHISKSKKVVGRVPSADGLPTISNTVRSTVLDVSRVNSLKRSINGHHDSVAKILLSGRDSIEKKSD